MGTEIEFIRFKPHHRVFGYRKHRKGGSHILLADLEKAVVDSLYMPRYASISIVYEALSGGFDRKVLEEYAIKMRSEAVIRQTGYLLEFLADQSIS